MWIKIQKWNPVRRITENYNVFTIIHIIHTYGNIIVLHSSPLGARQERLVRHTRTVQHSVMFPVLSPSFGLLSIYVPRTYTQFTSFNKNALYGRSIVCAEASRTKETDRPTGRRSEERILLFCERLWEVSFVFVHFLDTLTIHTYMNLLDMGNITMFRMAKLARSVKKGGKGVL